MSLGTERRGCFEPVSETIEPRRGISCLDIVPIESPENVTNYERMKDDSQLLHPDSSNLNRYVMGTRLQTRGNNRVVGRKGMTVQKKGEQSGGLELSEDIDKGEGVEGHSGGHVGGDGQPAQDKNKGEKVEVKRRAGRKEDKSSDGGGHRVDHEGDKQQSHGKGREEKGTGRKGNKEEDKGLDDRGLRGDLGEVDGHPDRGKRGKGRKTGKKQERAVQKEVKVEDNVEEKMEVTQAQRGRDENPVEGQAEGKNGRGRRRSGKTREEKRSNEGEKPVMKDIDSQDQKTGNRKTKKKQQARMEESVNNESIADSKEQLVDGEKVYDKHDDKGTKKKPGVGGRGNLGSKNSHKLPTCKFHDLDNCIQGAQIKTMSQGKLFC